MRKNMYSFFRFLLPAVPVLFLPLFAAAQATVSGKLYRQDGKALPGVVVAITGTVNSFAITDTLGQYSFSLPTGGAYTIAPQCNTEPLSGVSTFDLVLIQEYIHGNLHFTTPYPVIAADIDNNGVVTAADSLEGRNLILGATTHFPNNTSWRFVRAGYVFPDSANPFQPPYPESFTTPNLTADLTGVDFIGVKIGDINLTAFLSNLTDSAYLSWIDGTVRIDANNNCLAEPGESPLQNWLVRAEGLNGHYYGKSAANGQFSVMAPPGTYAFTLLPPSNLWAPCQSPLPNVTTTQLGHTTVEFPVQAAVECPYMTVDLSTERLRRCFTNSYHVNYCNQGTTVAENASVVVTFDPFLEVQSSSIPWTAVNGNAYTFSLGNVAPGACGSFYVNVLVRCDAQPGQTHCSSAQVYPDTLCTPPNPLWSGANLEVEGHCDGSQVIFTIKNTGAPMTQPSGYVVIEDIMIQMNGGPIQLNTNQTEMVALPANGSTWRLEMPQAPYHPWSSLPSAAVEGCGTNAGGSYSMGLVTQFPYGDERPTFDLDCLENVSSYDPNDKQGFPRGVTTDHYIPKNQEITYKIRFQNTGTDTAFNIMILDTLPAQLDLATLRMGSSSHPYSYNVLGEGVLQFLFQHVLLPDSNVNEPLSHGFVQFTISPRTDLPNNTVLENEAAIYFDFNAPVLTNRTRHTIGQQYLSVSNVVFRPGLDLTVFPNPSATSVTFSLKSTPNLHGQLRIFDSRGRMVCAEAFQSNVFQLSTAQWPAGMYYFRIESEGQALASGKLVVQRGE